MPNLPLHQESPLALGLRGARANLVPGLALQAFALALVLAYYRHAPTHAWLERLAVFRSEQGFLYSIVATAFFGGALPCLYLALNPATRGRYDLKQSAWLTAFWAYKGVECDLWFRFLARTVGQDASFPTVFTKMLLDQFVYSTVLAVPGTVAAYLFCEHIRNRRAFVEDLRAPRWYARRVFPVLVSNMGVWIPGTTLTFCLPTALQLPMSNLILCFFTLLLAHITVRQKQTP